jgi:hypothetical protein
MKSLAMLSTAAILAAVPASIGLIGNAEFSKDVPVRPPARAILLDTQGRPVPVSARVHRLTDDGAARRAENRGRHRGASHVERADDRRGSVHLEPGDDGGGSRSGSTDRNHSGNGEQSGKRDDSGKGHHSGKGEDRRGHGGGSHG